MRRVHTKKPAAIGSHHFHRHKCRQWAHNNSLLLSLATVSRTHSRGLECRDHLDVLIGHRHPLHEEDHRDYERRGEEKVDHYSPHMEEVVANMRIATQRADYGRKGA